MKRCPKCNNLMSDDAARCIKCGAESRPATLAAGPAGGPRPAARGDGTIRQPVTAGAGAGTARPGRIRSGWMLVRLSWRVLMLDKEMLVFPLLSGLSCLLVLAGFIGGIWASGLAQREEAVGEAGAWIAVFAWYFVNYFVIVFFNSALVACAMIRFHGGDPTVGDGLRAASERIAQIASWALLAATVGVVLRMVEERAELIGRIVIALLGAAWTIASYFVVPVLVVEKLGPFDAFKRSPLIIKKTWGESLVSNVGIGAITFLAGFVLVAITIVATVVLAVNLQSFAIVWAGVAVLVTLLILLALVTSALNAIVLSALYLYAADDKVPEAFEGAGLQQAFAPR